MNTYINSTDAQLIEMLVTNLALGTTGLRVRSHTSEAILIAGAGADVMALLTGLQVCGVGVSAALVGSCEYLLTFS